MPPKKRQKLASAEHLGDKPGGRGSLPHAQGAHGDAVIFGYFSKMLNNLSEFKLTVARGGTLEEIKIPSSNDGNCRCRQEVIDK